MDRSRHRSLRSIFLHAYFSRILSLLMYDGFLITLFYMGRFFGFLIYLAKKR